MKWKVIETAAGKLMNNIPVLNTFSGVLPALQSALASESDFKDALNAVSSSQQPAK